MLEGGTPSNESCLADYPVIRRVVMFDSRHIKHAIAGSLRIGLLPFRVAGQSPKEKPMSLKLVTFIAHDGKALIKVNPLRVNYLVSLEQEYTKIHFGLDQTIDVTGSLDAVEQALSAV